jgi:hypothetical protein
MGQQHRKKIKRIRRKAYLARKRERELKGAKRSKK